MEAGRTEWKIVEHINGLALLAARRVIASRGVLTKAQQLRMAPTFMAMFVKEGRPGFLLVFDVTRTLALEGDLTISEIADRTGRTLSTASRLVDALEAAGLVTRTDNPADGRSRLVGLTEAGREAVVEMRGVAAAPLMERLERLSVDERQVLERILEKLAAPRPAEPAEVEL